MATVTYTTSGLSNLDLKSSPPTVFILVPLGKEALPRLLIKAQVEMSLGEERHSHWQPAQGWDHHGSSSPR